MSACISRRGEYSSHELNDVFVCTWCGVLDEDAFIAQLSDALKVVYAAQDWYLDPLGGGLGPLRDAVAAWRATLSPTRSSATDAVPTPPPADPAGLDAAIEAANQAQSCVHALRGFGPCTECRVRAAAPHIRRAVLLEAADELSRFAVGEEVGVLRWLRERAER